MDYKEWNDKKEDIADELRKKAAEKKGLTDTPEEQRKLKKKED